MLSLRSSGRLAGAGPWSVKELAHEYDFAFPLSLRQFMFYLRDRPLNIIVLGDSVAWGQGLRDEDKYSSRVQRWLAGELQPRAVNPPRIYAHSGANIQDPLDDKIRRPGEVPNSFPTINGQVDVALEDLQSAGIPRHAVDLVLLDGGINDVGVFNILSTDPTVGVDWVRRLVQRRVFAADGNQMQSLVGRVLEAFPRAKVVVPNYYKVVSMQTGVDDLVGLLTAIALVFATVFAAPTFAAALVLRNKLDKQSAAFAEEYDKGIRAVVDATDSSRVRLANVGFTDDNAYGAPDSYLWEHVRLSWDLFDGEDPMAQSRAEQCAATQGAPRYCRIASLGHPNVLGATRYANAIIRSIASDPLWMAAWKGGWSYTASLIDDAHWRVDAVDPVSGRPPEGAVVSIGGAQVGSVGASLAPRPSARWVRVKHPRSLEFQYKLTHTTATVRAPGYADTSVDLSGVEVVPPEPD